jgi:hypothetical protein
MVAAVGLADVAAKGLGKLEDLLGRWLGGCRLRMKRTKNGFDMRNARVAPVQLPTEVFAAKSTASSAYASATCWILGSATKFSDTLRLPWLTLELSGARYARPA